MSYRSLHIGLLLLLLGLDVCMINLSGMAAFWLRCRTAVFDEIDHQVFNLVQDEKLLWGVRDKGKYRESTRVSKGHWIAFSKGEFTSSGGGRTVRVGSGETWSVEFNLGTMCYLDMIQWSVSADIVPLTTFQFRDVSGSETSFPIKPVYLPKYNLLRFSGIDRVAQTVILKFGPLGRPVQFGEVQIWGYDTLVPGLLSRPVTQIPLRPYEYLLGLWNVVAFLALLYCGAYRITKSLEILDDFRIVMKSVALTTITVVLILFLYRGYQEATYLGFEFSRLVVILGACLATILLTLNRAIVDAVHLYFLRKGVGIRDVLIVGAGPAGQRIVDRLRTHYWLAYHPAGYIDDNPQMHGKLVQGLKVLGGTNRLSEFAADANTDEIIVALPNTSHKAVRDIVGRCHSENLKFRILPDLFEVISNEVQVGTLDGVPVLDLDDHYLGKWDRFVKRGMDVSGAIVGLVLLSPLMVVLSIFIKLTSRGPTLFVQNRIGEHGKTFRFFKFRSMRVIGNEKARLERELQYNTLIQGDTPAGKILNTERVTRVGRFMRRFSLDELPQILNVLRGEMSLVGPRPPIPYEVESYNTWHMERFKGKPGISGLWQVSGRADLPFEDMVKLDLYYLRHWSLWMDFKILMKTIPVVFSGRGA